MTVPAISIIVPTYNRCEMLRRTLQSLLVQNFHDISHEVIVVDNNSNDRTREVVEEFVSANPSDFRYAFEPQEGIPYARNKGLAEARAPIIAFTDDDGFVDVDWAFQIKTIFDQQPEVSYLGGKVLAKWSHEPPAWLTEKHWSPLALADFGNEPFYIDLTNPICLITANFACRREIIDEVGPFSLEFARCQDHELQVRIWKAGKRGMYRPEIIVTADVPEERLTKTYHRRWHRRHGFYMAKLREEDFEQSQARFLDVPAAVYRRLISYTGRWLYSTITGNRDGAFTYETELSFFLGYFQNRISKYYKFSGNTS